MRDAGAGWGAALMSMFKGHRMTEEQAANCIASSWRRYGALANFQENRGAAITIQAAHRGMRERGRLAFEANAAAVLQARIRGAFTREVTDFELVEYRAATYLQAQWRTHMACEFVAKLRWQKQSRLKRTFSWNKGSKRRSKARANAPPRPAPAAAAARAPRRPPPPLPPTPRSPPQASSMSSSKSPGPPQAGKPVRRASSFDRFTGRGRKDTFGLDPAPKAATTPAVPSKQLLFILLSRGPSGLGLELDATNTIINIIKGGAADVQGYFKLGDTIASVDGIPLRGRLLQEVMDPKKSSYSFDVWRLARVAPDPPKSKEPLRRAISFDRAPRDRRR